MAVKRKHMPGCRCCGVVTSCSQFFQVYGCFGQFYNGCTVSVYTSEGGELLASGVTAVDGYLILTWSGGSPVYVTVDEPSGRFEPYGRLLTINCNAGITSTTITLTPASDYTCALDCLLPLKKEFAFTVSPGSGIGADGGTGTASYTSDYQWIGVINHNWNSFMPLCPSLTIPVTYTFRLDGGDHYLQISYPAHIDPKGTVCPGGSGYGPLVCQCPFDTLACPPAVFIESRLLQDSGDEPDCSNSIAIVDLYGFDARTVTATE